MICEPERKKQVSCLCSVRARSRASTLRHPSLFLDTGGQQRPPRATVPVSACVCIREEEEGAVGVRGPVGKMLLYAVTEAHALRVPHRLYYLSLEKDVNNAHTYMHTEITPQYPLLKRR